jgi:uncharacterized membrane protein (UPF0127 family)
MMKKLRVVNLSTGGVVLEEAEVCETFWLRLKGLLGRKFLSPGQGIIIRPCRSVHTVGMSFPIDVAFVDREGFICLVLENMRPNRLSPNVRNAFCVVEAPAGTFKRMETAAGDRLRLEEI